jgi:hypothetical protein
LAYLVRKYKLPILFFADAIFNQFWPDAADEEAYGDVEARGVNFTPPLLVYGTPRTASTSMP